LDRSRINADRRTFLTTAAAAGALVPLAPAVSLAARAILTRKIPKSGQMLPAIGMGTWITFNVGRVPALRASRRQVLKTFFDLGGGLIDS